MVRVDTEDLIDANDVARIVGLAHRNTVSQYQQKYPDMPRPVIDLGGTRARLWLKPEIDAWVQQRQPVRRGRPRKSSATPAIRRAASSGDNAPPLGGRRQRGGRKRHLS
jgi:predicted DNA-binding transcriptional regulator AlpA